MRSINVNEKGKTMKKTIKMDPARPPNNKNNSETIKTVPKQSKNNQNPGPGGASAGPG